MTDPGPTPHNAVSHHAIAADKGPFGLDLSLAVFDRATRLARSLFASAGASIILAHGGQIWRSRYAGTFPANDPFTEQVLAGGELCWIEDGLTHVEFCDHPLVTGPPHLRFTVAVPIRLPDGSTPGVLSVSGREPQPYDARKAVLLKDIADFVADEWRRVQTAAELATLLEERDRVLEANTRSEARLQLALALSEVQVFDLDYRRRELNLAGAEDTFRAEPLSFENLIEDILVTIDPRDHATVMSAWRDHVTMGTPFRPLYRVIRLDGAEAWAQASIKFFFDDKGPVRMVGAVQNVTARKAAEQALLAAREEADAANRAKSAFLATMSHELRTPLNAILGFSELIRDQIMGPAPARYVDYARDIHASGRHLLELVDDILDISKLEAGKFELREADFDLHDLLVDVTRQFNGLADAAGVSLHFDVVRLPHLRADRRLLKQVLLNAMSNALKFSDRGGTVTVTCAPLRGAGLALEISDTGIGMSAEEMIVALTPFGQVESEIARRSKGTGLGLPIARALMRLHGGDLVLASALGDGTTVTLTLPASRVLDTPESQAVA